MKITRFLSFLGLVILASCNLVSQENPSQSNSPISSVADADTTRLTNRPTSVPSHTIERESTVTPDLTPEPSSTSFPTETPTPVPISSQAPDLQLWEDCPEVVVYPQPIWENGSILFSTGRLDLQQVDPNQPEQPGIWAISADDLAPKLIYDIPSHASSWVIISDDGRTLLRFERENENHRLVFYDLATSTETELSVDIGSAQSIDWLPDNTLSILVDEAKTRGEGVTRNYVLIDPASQQVENRVEELVLPGYMFDSNEMLPSGFASISPNGNIILYTAIAENGIDNILLERQTGEVIWQQVSRSIPGFPEPLWSSDGSRVLFPFQHDRYEEIISLRQDGILDDLPSQPFPMLDQTVSRFLTRSPNDQYIVYGVWGSFLQGPGFVIDTHASRSGEICAPNAVFIDGFWLTDSLFVHRFALETGGHSLRVLNLEDWTSQVLFETNAGYGTNLFGWTPIEFAD